MIVFERINSKPILILSSIFFKLILSYVFLFIYVIIIIIILFVCFVLCCFVLHNCGVLVGKIEELEVCHRRGYIEFESGNNVVGVFDTHMYSRYFLNRKTNKI